MKKLTFLAIMSAGLVASSAVLNAQTILSKTHAGQTLGPIALTTPVPPGFFPFGGGLTDVVAANVDSEGQLKVIDWSTYEGTLVRNGDAVYTPEEEGSEPTSISAIGLDSGHILTAHADGTGRLTIITWQMSCTRSSAICLVKSVSVPNYATLEYPFNPQAVSVTALSPTKVVTAAANSEDELAVQVWDINPTTYLPTAAGPAQTYEHVQGVTVSAINSSQVVTAAQNTDGTVEIALYDVGRKTVQRVATATGTSYAVSQFALGTDFFGDIFTANVKAGDGHLSIVFWAVSTEKSKLELIPSAPVKKGSGDHQIAAAWLSAIDFLTFTEEGTTAPVTAMSDAGGNLDVDFWSQSKELSHNATDYAIDTISIVPLGGVFSIPENRSVSYFATGDRSSITGDLEIKLWSN